MPSVTTPLPVSDTDGGFLPYAGMNLAGGSGTAGRINPFMYGMFEDSEDVTNYMAMKAMTGGMNFGGAAAGVVTTITINFNHWKRVDIDTYRIYVVAKAISFKCNSIFTCDKSSRVEESIK